jgi:hypothetical protein
MSELYWEYVEWKAAQRRRRVRLVIDILIVIAVITAFVLVAR